jgi:hypothetical protein
MRNGLLHFDQATSIIRLLEAAAKLENVKDWKLAIEDPGFWDVYTSTAIYEVTGSYIRKLLKQLLGRAIHIKQPK